MQALRIFWKVTRQALWEGHLLVPRVHMRAKEVIKFVCTYIYLSVRLCVRNGPIEHIG